MQAVQQYPGEQDSRAPEEIEWHWTAPVADRGSCESCPSENQKVPSPCLRELLPAWLCTSWESDPKQGKARTPTASVKQYYFSLLGEKFIPEVLISVDNYKCSCFCFILPTLTDILKPLQASGSLLLTGIFVLWKLPDRSRAGHGRQRNSSTSKT